MWILVVEAMGALSCLLLIVWWTLGPTHRRERDALREAALQQALDRAKPATERDPKSSQTESSS
jgi:hypothetical protein